MDLITPFVYRCTTCDRQCKAKRKAKNKTWVELRNLCPIINKKQKPIKW